MIKKKNCKKHGYTNGIIRISKNKEWLQCLKCKQYQDKKAASKYRKSPKNKEYYRNKSKEIIESRHLLASLLMLLSYILPPD